MPRPTVAIVGRPNVGKSTLFNRLVGERTAIVEDTPGITRDRMHGEAEWAGIPFTVVDTGGLGMTGHDPFGEHIQQQAELAIEQSDLVLLVVDGREGLSPADAEVAAHFRKLGRPIILAVNKADNTRVEQATSEFYSLGLGEPWPISAHSGRGVGDLLQEVVARLPEEEVESEEDDRIKIAIVGRPNVGKSSLMNAILGEDRVIVSSIAGTTRDAIDVPFTFGSYEFTLIDTAGIRRASKYQGSVEFYTVLRAERALERCDVAVTVVDAAAGLSDGDKRVAGMSVEQGKGCVFFVNKWDLVQGLSPREFGKNLRAETPFVSYSPIVVGSAEQGKSMEDLLQTCADVAESHAMRVSTPDLNRVIREAMDRRPYTRRGHEFKIYYATQIRVKPPTFVFFANNPKLAHISYLRYLENQLRAAFGFAGTPVRLWLRKRGEDKD